MNLEFLLAEAKKAAAKASVEILKIYDSGDFSVETKSDDSPLTKADKAAHDAIISVLEPVGIPILSEEGRDIPYSERKKWDYFWMIDPLDGTKEFIKRNGEFTVNIALIHQYKSILGVVHVPVSGDMYWGMVGQGSFKNGVAISVSSFDLQDAGLRVVASRSHMNADTEEYLNKLNDPQIVSKGSSLKLLLIAEGEADLYPRYAPTMEWDTAAAQAVLEAAGGKVIEANTNLSVNYNKENLLNPYFEVLGDHTGVKC